MVATRTRVTLEAPMSTTRREFLDKLTAGSLALGAMPMTLHAMPHDSTAEPVGQQGGYDTAWGSRLTGRLKAVFDVPEVENGWGAWRAIGWGRTYEATLGTPLRDLSSVMVVRHNAIILAMNQAFWDKYGIGKAKGVGHPLTAEPTTVNPALMTVKDGLPERFGHNSLGDFQQRGGIVLACALAFEFDIVGLIAATDKVPEAEAWNRGRGYLAPGVILQPTGVFAVMRAQEAGAMYIRAS
jgi:hypothetical protein